MRRPRTTIFLLAVIVAALGLNSALRMSGTQNPKAISGQGEPTLVAASSKPDNSDRTAESTATPTVMRESLPAILPEAKKTFSLSGDANALVAEMCSLQLLADNADLSLTSREWSGFATVVLRIQAIRQNYEAQIATTEEIGPKRRRVKIPAYAAMGDALRELFHTELRAELGDAKAEAVFGKLGGRLEGRFAGFGVSLQTLDVAASSDGALNDVTVTRTVTYWNSVEGEDSLSVRREICLPALEDPAGDSWSALLAMVKA